MLTILVVEDDIDISDFLQDFLTMKGYAVEVAATGREALECLRHIRPAAILSDLRMPVMDGLAFSRILSDTPEYHTIPVILMSGGDTPSPVDAPLFAAFLEKPLSLKKLQTTLEAVIASSKPSPGG